MMSEQSRQWRIFMMVFVRLRWFGAAAATYNFSERTSLWQQSQKHSSRSTRCSYKRRLEASKVAAFQVRSEVWLNAETAKK